MSIVVAYVLLLVVYLRGLEFDSVIINKVDSDIFDIHNPYDMKLLYVSMTRALHEEIIVYQNELVDVLK